MISQRKECRKTIEEVGAKIVYVEKKGHNFIDMLMLLLLLLLLLQEKREAELDLGVREKRRVEINLSIYMLRDADIIKNRTSRKTHLYLRMSYLSMSCLRISYLRISYFSHIKKRKKNK